MYGERARVEAKLEKYKIRRHIEYPYHVISSDKKHYVATRADLDVGGSAYFVIKKRGCLPFLPPVHQNDLLRFNIVHEVLRLACSENRNLYLRLCFILADQLHLHFISLTNAFVSSSLV